MKAATSPFATFTAAYTGNVNISWTNFFIKLILAVNIIAQLFIFSMYKLVSRPALLMVFDSLILWIATISSFLLALLFIRKHAVEKIYRKRQQYKIERKMLHLETKALRARMNPHFIFNCMNSIKLLIQQKDDEKAITYLSIFSKLMRAILYNSEKREVTLFEEIETCRLYTQLEGLRLGSKLTCHFTIDESIDLKSVILPELTIQPFIENAIWHGLMPKENGGTLHISLVQRCNSIHCMIDDDGIGRDASIQNKHKSTQAYSSAGIRLTRSRLGLNNSLYRRSTSVEIIDKKNMDNLPAGTRVILVFATGW